MKYEYLLCAIGSLCILHLGVDAEACDKGVLARRETYHVTAGGTLSLSCVVQHCGENWTSDWIWKNSTDDTFIIVKNATQWRLTNVKLSTNKTQLVLDFVRVTELDEGSYGCRVMWSKNKEVDQGHLMYVNVSAVVPSERTLLHRILVCSGASLCLPVVLGLVLCLKSRVKHQPLPRNLNPASAQPTIMYERPLHQSTPQPLPRKNPFQKISTSSKKAPCQPKEKTEVLYADISQEALRQQRIKKSDHPSTVYSSLRFS